MIVMHPMQEAFNMVHHPSYYDFYHQVLPQTRDPAEMEGELENGFAVNKRYIDLYRNSYAYHGVHPFYMWYWACHGMDHMGRVIAVNPECPQVAERIGFDTAPTLEWAIDQAKEIVGRNPQISYFHCPPVVMCDVS